MKKIKCVYIIILSSLLLSACNGRVESTPISEEELINENLRLKDQVADLKMELQARKQREAALEAAAK